MSYINPFIPYYKRLTLFVLCIILCFILTTFLSVMTVNLFGTTPATVRIFVIIQNFVSMILPATIITILISNNPIGFWGISKCPSVVQLVFTFLIMIVSIPAMNLIVAWNMSIHLPESLSAIEVWMRNLENAAADTTFLLLDNNNIYSLIITILAVGIFTGFSEELLFRGTLMRIFQSRPMNIHIAIWLTAMIFSFIHFQFFGFIPRILLGAFFGYLFIWTKSLWMPIIAHVVNNSIVVIFSYNVGADIATNSEIALGVNNGIYPNIYSIVSCILTIILLFIFHRFYSLKQS